MFRQYGAVGAQGGHSLAVGGVRSLDGISDGYERTDCFLRGGGSTEASDAEHGCVLNGPLSLLKGLLVKLAGA